MAIKSSDLLTRVEAAKYLGVGATTLTVWAHTKKYKLPYRKVGKKVQYLVSDLDRFIEQRTKRQE